MRCPALTPYLCRRPNRRLVRRRARRERRLRMRVLERTAEQTAPKVKARLRHRRNSSMRSRCTRSKNVCCCSYCSHGAVRSRRRHSSVKPARRRRRRPLSGHSQHRRGGAPAALPSCPAHTWPPRPAALSSRWFQGSGRKQRAEAAQLVYARVKRRRRHHRMCVRNAAQLVYARVKRRQERAAPRLRLSASLCGPAQACRSKSKTCNNMLVY